MPCRETTMLDAAFFLLVLVCFALTIGYVYASDRL